MAARLTEKLVEFVEGGMSVLVGTRDASLRPEALRGVGAKVAPDRTRVTVYLNAELAARTLANLENNAQIAVAFSRVVDHRTIQLKGDVIAVRRTPKKDRPIQEAYMTAFAEQVYLAGLPRSITRRLRFWPSVAIEFEVREVFEQTPGPGAGKRMDLPA